MLQAVLRRAVSKGQRAGGRDMAKLRTLIVDDEPLARERIRHLLEGEGDVEVVDECEDGMAALELLRQRELDLVFLDVQMPELDGFGLLAQLEVARLPAIIFVTAHDQFALRAFEVHALDYLLKPIDQERFRAAVERARQWLSRRGDESVDARLTALLADLKGSGGPKVPDRIAVKAGGRVILVKAEDIDWVEAADNYVSLHVGSASHLLRETMNSLEQRLPPDRFLRISRSTIVNLDRVRELQPLFHGEYAVILSDGTRLNLSRGYRDRLSILLGKE
jgi:two-component system LytT family response regulator